jgi:hypothetical protein
MYKTALVTILFVAAFWVLIFSLMPKHNVVAYDCRLSEISPDFPIEVKEQCRKLRAQNGRI